MWAGRLPKIWLLFFLLAWLLSGCQKSPESSSSPAAKPQLSGEEMLYEAGGQIFIFNPQTKQTWPVTNNSKNNFSPNWLAPGKEVMYVSEAGGYFEIWRHDLVNESKDLLWGSKYKPIFISLSPDRLWLIYAEETGCYLFNIKQKHTQRFADACQNVAWDKKDKKFVYTQDDILYLLDFNVKQELSSPQPLFKGYVAAPIFADYKTLIFESNDVSVNNQDNAPAKSESEEEIDANQEEASSESEDENISTTSASYDLYQFSLDNYSCQRLTTLAFSDEQDVYLELSPDAKKLIYKRVDSESGVPVVWLVNLNNMLAAKKILTNVDDIEWGLDSDSLYFVQAGDIYTATKDGFNKEMIVKQASQPIFFHNIKNQYSPL